MYMYRSELCMRSMMSSPARRPMLHIGIPIIYSYAPNMLERILAVVINEKLSHSSLHFLFKTVVGRLIVGMNLSTLKKNKKKLRTNPCMHCDDDR